MADGWIILDKPSGITSTKAGSILKKIFNEKKQGHLGTLDPMASGVLPIVFGEATKTIPYINNKQKEYIFNLVFGSETDSLDATGLVLKTDSKRPIKKDILAKIPAFLGIVEQIPPKYSAIHLDGKRAYELVRKGIDFEIKPRKIEIFELELLDYDEKFNNWAKFRTLCSEGTYIRTLASDIAKSLGLIGHIDYLRRIKSGPFLEKSTVSLEILKKMFNNNEIESLVELLRPIDMGLGDIPVIEISAENQARILKGMPILGEGNGPVRIYSNGTILAIGETRNGYIYPKRLLTKLKR